MIITDPVQLRKECLLAKPEEVDGILAALEAELIASGQHGQPGIGLAGPQIGILKKIAICRVPSDSGLKSINLVNCKIKTGYDRFLFTEEGCLSFPGQIESVYRYREIHVIDNLVPPHSFIAEGLLAVCIQHELDHLNGVLLPDRAVKKQLIETSLSGQRTPIPLGLIQFLR